MREPLIHSLDELLLATGCADQVELWAMIADTLELDSELEVTASDLTVVMSGGCTTSLTFPFLERALWKALSDLDHWSMEDLEATEAAAYARTHVLVHLDPIDSELYGVWVSDEVQVASGFYPGGEMCAEHQYAEEVITGDSWVVQIERLPRNGPSMANWEAVPREADETAEAAFRRIERML